MTNWENIVSGKELITAKNKRKICILKPVKEKLL